MMLLNRDSAIQSSSRRFCTIYKLEKLDPLQPSGRRDIPFRHPTVQSIIRLDDENFLSRPSSVSRSFELFQLAYIRTFQQHVRTTLNVRSAMGFLSKTQIWEDLCNCPDNVDSRSDALIYMASCAFKIQTSGLQHSWSRCASYIYGNCMHLINRPDDYSLSPDLRSLNMEIAYNWSVTVQTTWQHRLDQAQIRKEFQWNFGKPIALLSVRMPYVYRWDGA